MAKALQVGLANDYEIVPEGKAIRRDVLCRIVHQYSALPEMPPRRPYRPWTTTSRSGSLPPITRLLLTPATSQSWNGD